MQQIHLWREEAVKADDLVTVSMTIESPGSESGHGSTLQPRTRLWYRLPAEYADRISDRADPFVVAILLIAMQQSTDLVVHGEVSPSLLQNLAEFQAAWACWRPQTYRQIEITADIERESPTIASQETAIAAFSGGVDSCLTAFRHKTGRCGRLARKLQTGLMVHGFDIPLNQSLVFERAVEKSKTILASLGLDLIPMTTNYRELQPKLNWLDLYGPAVASCLMLFQKGYTTGLIGSAFSYHNLLLPRGSNPVTDHLLSSQSFQIIHDGAGLTRLGKIQEIANWPEAIQNLRVCWEGVQLDRNCGRCEKCIRTILGFRVLGLGLPGCFDQDITDEQILGIKGLNHIQLYELDLILEEAKTAGLSESWVTALEKCISRNRLRLDVEKGKAALKERIPPALTNSLRQWRSLLSK